VAVVAAVRVIGVRVRVRVVLRGRGRGRVHVAALVAAREVVRGVVMLLRGGMGGVRWGQGRAAARGGDGGAVQRGG
jgi:hypothetical protein